MHIIRTINKIGFGLLRFNSRLKNVRDLAIGHPARLIRRHLRSGIIRWFLRR